MLKLRFIIYLKLCRKGLLLLFTMGLSSKPNGKKEVELVQII